MLTRTLKRRYSRVCRRLAMATSLVLAIVGTSLMAGASDADAASTAAVIATNKALGRGVNLGNALEAPVEGEWGLTLEADWFDVIANAGFDSVRVPIRWSAHAANAAPYRIDAGFFQRVDWVLAQAERTGLYVIVDMHHDDALMSNPRGANRQRFLSMWRQIANRYRNASDTVVFEVLNEPHGVFSDDPALWNQLLAEGLSAIRQTNPTRAVIVGPVGYNAINRLDDLELPDDPNLIVSVHYYEPFAFTHQGAEWVEPRPESGVTWHNSTTGLAGGTQSWSWDTTLTPGLRSLGIAFDRQYAGFSPRVESAVDPRRLIIKLRGKVDLAVGCSDDSGNFNYVDEITGAGNRWRRYAIDLRACAADTTRLALQNRLTGRSSFEVRYARLCTINAGCRWLVANARTSVKESFEEARQWGRDNKRPMHLGEFGAYGTGDLASRIRWTRDVQRYARASGLSTAYWEFGAGFGVYDPVARRWRTSLLKALLP